ncbi:MAG: NYN domain-containing protein [Methylovulum sp.]
MSLPIESKKFAVLIDADNAQAIAIEVVLAEIARYGLVTSKRCYGDWTQPNSNSWKTILLRHAIQPIQQFAYNKGKNATDSAMIIDAMDLLYTGNFDGFCIISSDSDFTKLATRLRESGMEVYGFGKKITPEPFRVACNKFIYTEVLMNGSEEIDPPNQNNQLTSSKSGDIDKSNSPQQPTAENKKNSAELKELLKEAFDKTEDDGWANLADIGNYIQRIKPDFDARNYAAGKKLSALIKSLEYIETESRNGQIYIKFK